MIRATTIYNYHGSVDKSHCWYTCAALLLHCWYTAVALLGYQLHILRKLFDGWDEAEDLW
jgi:hypothetical protein